MLPTDSILPALLAFAISFGLLFLGVRLGVRFGMRDHQRWLDETKAQALDRAHPNEE